MSYVKYTMHTGLTLRALQTPEELINVFPIIQELRSHLDLEQYMTVIECARRNDDYQILAAEIAGKTVGVIGVRVLFDLTHGKHLYIDDLVVTDSHRSKGIGADLIHFAEQLARQKKCAGIRLCTGIDNQRGQSFYKRQGLVVKSIAYKKNFEN